MTSGEILDDILQRHGSVTPEIVVAESKKKNHPWHDRIWGETEAEAAHQRRLDVARGLIRSVRLVVVKGPPLFTAPAWVRNPEAGPREQGYLPVAKIRTEKETAIHSMELERDRVSGAIDRMASLAMAYSLENYMDQLLDGIGLYRAIKQAAE